MCHPKRSLVTVIKEVHNNMMLLYSLHSNSSLAFTSLKHKVTNNSGFSLANKTVCIMISSKEP